MTPEATNHFNEILMNERNYNLIEEPQSDYEAIDTSLFGWWKAKLRKSQIRKVMNTLFRSFKQSGLIVENLSFYKLFNFYFIYKLII